MDPKEVQKEKALAAMEAELALRRKMRAKNDEKTKMKGKNRQSKRHRKKQLNVVDDRRFKALVCAKSRKVFLLRRLAGPAASCGQTGWSVEGLTRRECAGRARADGGEAEKRHQGTFRAGRAARGNHGGIETVLPGQVDERRSLYLIRR
jgi:hypothetical protein